MLNMYTHMRTGNEFCSSPEALTGKVSIVSLTSLFTCDNDGNKLFEAKSSPFDIVKNGKGDVTLCDEGPPSNAIFELLANILYNSRRVLHKIHNPTITTKQSNEFIKFPQITIEVLVSSSLKRYTSCLPV